MHKKFLANLTFFLTVNLIIKPIYVFGIDRVVQNRVGVEEYGNYFSLFNFILILQIILDLGIENFNRKELAEAPGKINQFFSMIAPLKIVLGFTYLIACALIAWFRNFTANEWSIFLILVANQFMASFILYLRANLGGLQKFKIEGVISVLDRGMMVVLCGFILYAPFSPVQVSIKWFVLSQTASYFISMVIALIFVLRFTGTLRLKINFKQYFPILRGLMPYALIVLLQAFYFRIDSVLLEELLPNGETQAGIFAHAFRIIELMSSYALLFPMILLPMFSKTISERGNPVSLLHLGLMILLIPSLAFLIGAIFYRYEIFDILYTSHTVQSADTFAILSLSFVGMCISYTLGALLTANRNLKQLNYMSFSAVVISFVLNFVLIPRYQVIGAAMANAFTQLFTIVVHFFLVNRYFKINWNVKQLLSTVVLFVSIVFIAFTVHLYIGNLVIGLLVILGLSLALAMALNVFRVKQFIEIVKGK